MAGQQDENEEQNPYLSDTKIIETIKRKMEAQQNINKLFNPHSILAEAIDNNKTRDQVKCSLLLSLTKNLK